MPPTVREAKETHLVADILWRGRQWRRRRRCDRRYHVNTARALAHERWEKNTTLMCISLTIKFMFINSVCFFPWIFFSFVPSTSVTKRFHNGSDCSGSDAGIHTHLDVFVYLRELFICVAACLCGPSFCATSVVVDDGVAAIKTFHRLHHVVVFFCSSLSSPIFTRVFCLSHEVSILEDESNAHTENGKELLHRTKFYM